MLPLAIPEAIADAATELHHSNWRLPIRLERLLNLLLVTPRMRGIHHSIVERETNSNCQPVEGSVRRRSPSPSM